MGSMDSMTASLAVLGVSDNRSSPNQSTKDYDQKPIDRYFSRRVAKVHEGYRSLVICPICIDILVDPHTLGPCGHTTCGPCFFAWEGSRVAPPTCPECCQRVQQVAKNGTIQGIIDALLYSMGKNHEEGWMKGDEDKNKERESYEERTQAWKERYSMIPQKSLQIASMMQPPAPVMQPAP